MPPSTVEMLERWNYTALKIPKCQSLSEPVSCHPDMLFSVLGERRVLTDRVYFESNTAFFDRLIGYGVEVSISQGCLSEKYPCDILFDAIKTDSLLVGNLKFTAPELFVQGVKTVNVKQGYALCSTLLLDGAAISADAGICKTLSENGYDILKITPGDIQLPGYGCGFVGGASAVLSEERVVVFFGDVYSHKDGEKIVAFCEKHGYKVCQDKVLPLTDYGGVKVFDVFDKLKTE